MESYLLETLLSTAAPVSIAIIFISFFILAKDDRKKHGASTMVTIGIAIASITVAIGSFYAKERSDSEHARTLAASIFYKSMWQFGATARHIRSLEVVCDFDSRKQSSFVNDECEASAALAERFSSSLPSLESTLNLVSNSAKDPASIHLITILLIDGEIALKQRMPVSVNLNTRAGSRANVYFRNILDDFEKKAEEMSAVYCLLAESTGRGWPEFNDLITRIAYKDLKPADKMLDLTTRINVIAKRRTLENIPCDKVPEHVQEVLPIGGGGN